ncbi:hypothetical protein TheetDRAFT_3188 [Thermoanaerobacter ethanolicus JW 200]|nr:hypothetical protein TheetDRAFT_3188 [Thermoanaerobacter ethanolicus JW 200]
MHEDPQIPNFGPPGRGPRLKKRYVPCYRTDGKMRDIMQ